MSTKRLSCQRGGRLGDIKCVSKECFTGCLLYLTGMDGSSKEFPLLDSQAEYFLRSQRQDTDGRVNNMRAVTRWITLVSTERPQVFQSNFPAGFWKVHAFIRGP